MGLSNRIAGITKGRGKERRIDVYSTATANEAEILLQVGPDRFISTAKPIVRTLKTEMIYALPGTSLFPR